MFLESTLLVALVVPLSAVAASAQGTTTKPKKSSTEKPSTTTQSSGKRPASAQKPNPHVVIKTSLGDITLELFVNETPKTVENFIGLAEGKKPSKNPKTGKMEKRKFYDGLVFHRVIPGFMAQGGCPLGNGSGSPGFRFGDEISAKALGLDKIMVFKDGKPNAGMFSLSRPDMSRAVIRPVCTELGISSQAEFQKRQAEVMKKAEKVSVLEAYKRLGFTYDDSRPSHRMQRGTIAMANSGPGTNGSQFFINFKTNGFLNGKHTVFGQVVDGMKVVDQMQKIKIGPRDRPVEPLVIRSIREVPAPKSKPGPGAGDGK